jgi:hypothetical protein
LNLGARAAKHADMIDVTRKAGTDPLAFEVVVREGSGESRHCIEAAFRFLLDREPKESILARFDVSVIQRYFADFERELPRYLGAL